MEMSLKDAIMNDIEALDEFFKKNLADDSDQKPEIMDRWGNVREAAIAFLDVFEKVNSSNESRT